MSTRDATPLEPMYASVGTALPTGRGWTFEPKYDGIRVLAFVASGAVRLMTRNRKDKARQFPEITAALAALVARARERGRGLVLDGEIVALSGDDPARFQQLQSRMHVGEATAIQRHAEASPAAFMAFDLLVDAGVPLPNEPWTTRRRQLERRLAGVRSPFIRLGVSSPNGLALMRQAQRAGWEGIVAKRTEAPYRAGVRSRDWLKLKIEHRQEFVVGGFTDPRNSRQHLGALLLGYFDGDRLIYVGHTGGGFTHDALREMHRRLMPLVRRTSPFTETPRPNETAHWVSPRVVVEVKFNEWTADGRLRQPIFLGVRDDKNASEVGREVESVQGVRRLPRKSARRAR
ncbi:MAG: non-homologous end-joining DNA ligase [Gemmatimonadaceae bacterium]